MSLENSNWQYITNISGSKSSTTAEYYKIHIFDKLYESVGDFLFIQLVISNLYIETGSFISTRYFIINVNDSSYLTNLPIKLEGEGVLDTSHCIGKHIVLMHHGYYYNNADHENIGYPKYGEINNADLLRLKVVIGDESKSSKSLLDYNFSISIYGKN